MYESSKYTTHEVILNRLTRTLRENNKAIDENDIIEWCQEVETEFCPNVDGMFLYTGIELVPKGHKVFLPCNIYRIIDLYGDPGNSHSRLSFKNYHRYIFLNVHHAPDKAYIDYYGTPIDFETGLPLILKGHEQACYWYCMYNLFLNDLATGKITGVFWNEIKENKETEIYAGSTVSVRHKTRGEMVDSEKISYNMIPIPARQRLISNDFKGWH